MSKYPPQFTSQYWAKKYGLYLIILLGLICLFIIHNAIYFLKSPFNFEVNILVEILFIILILYFAYLFFHNYSQYKIWSRIDLEQFYDISGGEVQAEEEFLDTFRIDFEETLLKLKKAIKENDFQNARIFSHSLKGASKSIGYTGLAKIALSMEEAFRDQKIEEGQSYIPKVQKEYEIVHKAMLDYLKYRYGEQDKLD